MISCSCKNEQYTEKNRHLSEERESFASQVEYLQAELTQNQMRSQVMCIYML